LLIATTVISVVLASAGAFFVSSRNFIQQQILRVETTQALRATLDNLQRDLRLGGACLTTTASFVALSGTNLGTTDTITTRTAVVSPTLVCVRTALTAIVAAGVTTLPVQTNPGFTNGMRAYIDNGDGNGEFFTVASVQASPLALQISPATSRSYKAAAGVYSIDERTYKLDMSNSALPTLTLAVNKGPEQAFAYGIESFGVQYTLSRNCPPCDVVDLPANNSEWMLVNEVSVSVTARSRVPGSNGQYYRQTGQVRLKPRNLLPGASVLGRTS
jgi:hypothetical protein